ncbi:MAG: DUF2213 domain-containing protein [Pseudomonadota bacterium]
MAISRVARVDVGSRLGKFARNGAGAVRVPATVARTGVQDYPEQGLKEYRPADEVFSADSLASLGSVPVTLKHPPRGVTPDNAREHQVGHVSDAAPESRVKVDGSGEEWVRAVLVVSDRDVQDALEGGHAGAVSCGYSCDLDMTPGVAPDGTKYDAVQRNIRFNHVAILTADQKPRAGGEAKVRLDSQGNPMKKIVIDGVELDYGSPEHFAHVAAAHQKALDAAKARADKAEAERDGIQAKLDAEKTRADAAVSNIDNAVEVRFALLQRAAKFLPGTYETSGKSNAQIRVDALISAKVDVTGKSEEYVSARFDGLTDANALAQWSKPAPAKVDVSVNINDSDDAFRASLAKQLSAKEDE